MNIVPFNAGQGGIRAFVHNALRAGRMLGPAAMNEAINLARHHGPDAYAWVRREVMRGGRRIFRGMRRREHGPMANQNRGPYQLGPSQSSFQVRGSRGFVGSRRGGAGRGRGGGRRVGRRRMPMRYGGRPMRQPELKSYDLQNNTVPVGPVISLVQVPVRDLTLGVTSNQRIGRKVFAKSMLLVGKIYNAEPTTVNTTSDSVWFWIVVDRQANGATAVPTDVWLDTVGSRALKNLDQGPRFKILRCMEVKVDAVAVGTHINQPFELYLPLGLTVHWKGLANAPPYKNDILVFASNSNAQNEDLRIEFSTRVRYTDV